MFSCGLDTQSMFFYLLFYYVFVGNWTFRVCFFYLLRTGAVCLWLSILFFQCVYSLYMVIISHQPVTDQNFFQCLPQMKKKKACSKFSDTCCWGKPNQGSGLHQAFRASPCQPKYTISNFFRTRPPLHVLASAICSGTLVTHLHIWGMGYCGWFAASVYLGKISTCF